MIFSLGSFIYHAAFSSNSARRRIFNCMRDSYAVEINFAKEIVNYIADHLGHNSLIPESVAQTIA